VSWEEAVWALEILLDDLDDIPDAGWDFADSVRESAESMKDWIEENEHVTERQLETIENWQVAVSKWIC
jgi:hypothetical protein